jgi:hypothetical protein
LPTILPGPTAVKGYAAIVAEAVGSEGSYVAPSARVHVTDATPHLAGGTMGMDPVAGSRWANQAPISAELVASCDINGPYVNGNALLLAALGKATASVAPFSLEPGELPAYSAEINPGLGNSIHLLGAGVDKFSLKGAVGSAVTYSATLKSKSMATAAQGAPTAAVVTPFGLAEISLTGPSLAAVATAFQIDIDNALKTQAVFSNRTSAYVFSTHATVTGKVTAVMTGVGDITTHLASGTVAIVITLQNAAGSDIFTMTTCKITDMSAPLKVGSNTVQDLSFEAFVTSGASALVLSQP